MEFAARVESMIDFMRENSIHFARIKDEAGSVAVIKRDKHGFYKVETTEVSHVRNV